jgi:putative ATP-dependent endonuclease of the OLD family
MYISSIIIKNFRSLKDISVELGNHNILIGPNNAGKTAFLEAINYAIGWKTRIPQEDDFYVSDTVNFNPKEANPIEILLEFREGYNQSERFSDAIQTDFDGIIQYDEESVREGEEPIRYIRLHYKCEYISEKNRYIESRSFLDKDFKEINGKDTQVKKIHLSYFPFFYLETLRDIKKEIKSPTSFWGRMKKTVDYSEKEHQIKRLSSMLDKLLVKNDEQLNKLVERLKEIERSITISNESDNIYLKAFSTRSWEILDGLTIYLKTANSNISLPIDKHGMGTQNIAIFVIFNAFLDILLPQIIENKEVTPIIGIEEPEAHVYPHSQRAIFEQINLIKGQKIVSTHSPYIIDQADINDYILFRNNNGVTTIRKVPYYKKEFKFINGLPEKAYQANLFLGTEDLHSLKRYIQFKNTELLFSSLLLLCEGDSEKIFFEMISQKYLYASLGKLGISVISCEGRNYSPFLKIASRDALNLPWIIISDGENDTIQQVKGTIKSNGYSDADIRRSAIFLPMESDFESYCINWLGKDAFFEIISSKYGHKKFEQFKGNLIRSEESKSKKGMICTSCGVPFGSQENVSVEQYTEEELINIFIDRHGKTIFGEYIAEYVLNHDVELPSEYHYLFELIKDKLEKGE